MPLKANRPWIGCPALLCLLRRRGKAAADAGIGRLLVGKVPLHDVAAA
jgi:murein endopeptidase